MLSNKVLSVVVAMFGLTSIAVSQWTQRYNNTSNKDDIANCVVVDKRGNVCVAGNVDSNSDEMNVVVHSYTSAGTARSGWPQVYNGAENGDDYVRSIHVDEDLNVYVAGASAGTSTTRWDMFVWKLDSFGSL